MTKRIKTIFSHLKKPLDAILLKNGTMPFLDDNFFYATGLEHGIYEGCLAVLYSDGDLDLIVSELEAESAKNSQAHLCIYKTKEEYAALIRHLSSSLKTVGLNFTGLLHQDFEKLQEQLPQAKFFDVSETLQTARAVKDPQELQSIKKACSIADTVMGKIPDFVSDGMMESELAAEIEYNLLKQGAERPAFDIISSFQHNTAEPHYSHGYTRLKKGSFVLCDFGACFQRYNSDITRTFVYGKASEQQKSMYETVLNAQQIGFDAIRPGVKAQAVHTAVSSFIDGTIYKGRFIHSTGHGLGLAVHDGPGFSSENSMELKENMVLTVEPGVYLPGLGGVRIEDDILIKKDGMEILTKASRKFQELR